MAKKIKCKSCGGLVLIEDGDFGGECQYCNTYQYDEDSACSEELRKLMSAAEGFMKIRKYAEAKEKFLAITDAYPQDYRGWWGLIRAKTYNLTAVNISKNELNELDELYEYVCKMAKNRNIDNVRSSYEEYSSAVRENLRRLKNDAQEKWDSLNDTYLRNVDSVNSEILKLQAAKSACKKPSTIVLTILSFLWGGFTIILSIFEDISNLPAGIFGFLILILPIWWICTRTIDSFYYKKVRGIDNQIRKLQNSLLTMERQNIEAQKPITDMFTKAGNV